jgi:hypothetical protein
MKLEFSQQFSKILTYTIPWKSTHWEPSCSMWIDRWTDMTKLIVTFCNFANAPNRNKKDLASYEVKSTFNESNWYFFGQCQYLKSYIDPQKVSIPKMLNLLFSSWFQSSQQFTQLHYTQYGILIVLFKKHSHACTPDTSPQLSYTGLYSSPPPDLRSFYDSCHGSCQVSAVEFTCITMDYNGQSHLQRTRD